MLTYFIIFSYKNLLYEYIICTYKGLFENLKNYICTFKKKILQKII
jgi:hypothetical protein